MSSESEQRVALGDRSRWLPDEATDQMGAPGSGIGLTSISIEFFRHQDGNYHLRQSFYNLNGRGNPLSFGWEPIPDVAFTIAGRLLHDYRTRERANGLARAWEKATDGEFKPDAIWIFVNRNLLVYEPCPYELRRNGRILRDSGARHGWTDLHSRAPHSAHHALDVASDLASMKSYYLRQLNGVGLTRMIHATWPNPPSL